MGTRPTPLVEERPVRRGRVEPEVRPRLGGCHASSVGTDEEPFAYEVGFCDRFDRFCFLADRDGQGREANWASRKTAADRVEDGSVEAIKASRIDLEKLKSATRGLEGQLPVTVHLGVVNDATQETVCDTGSAARTRRDLVRGLRIDGRSEQRSGTGHDGLKLVGLVELKVGRKAKAVTQRGGQQARARCRTDDREGRERQRNRRRAGALTNDDIDAEIFHREVEHFLGCAREAVDLIDEQDVAFLEARQDRRQVARMLDRRSGGQAQRGSHFGGDDHGERRFAQPRRARKQDMVGAG